MRLGIGGGIGPIRGGISTRGIGLGAGPFRVGTGWGGSGAIAASLAVLIPLLLVALVIFWPYLLGTWVAVQLGAGEQSMTRDVVGWVFEAIYLLVLIAGWLSSWMDRRTQRREELRLAAEDQRRRALEVAEGGALLSRELLRCIEGAPQGSSDPSVPKKERLLLRIESVWLVEPRSIQRGGPRPQTRIAAGRADITDRAIRFIGSLKTVEWRYDKMLDIGGGTDHLAFTVANRRLISGIATDECRNDLMILALRWGASVSEGLTMTDVVNEAAAIVNRMPLQSGPHKELTGTPAFRQERSPMSSPST